MLWNRIIVIKEWFGDMAERYRLVRDFNKAAKMSFITGHAPTLSRPGALCAIDIISWH